MKFTLSSSSSLSLCSAGTLILLSEEKVSRNNWRCCQQKLRKQQPDEGGHRSTHVGIQLVYLGNGRESLLVHLRAGKENGEVSKQEVRPADAQVIGLLSWLSYFSEEIE